MTETIDDYAGLVTRITELADFNALLKELSDQEIDRETSLLYSLEMQRRERAVENQIRHSVLTHIKENYHNEDPFTDEYHGRAYWNLITDRTKILLENRLTVMKTGNDGSRVFLVPTKSVFP